jgi:hypothetical protein
MSKQCLIGLKDGRVTYITTDVTNQERLAILEHGCDSVVTTDLVNAPDFKAACKVKFEKFADTDINSGWTSVKDGLPPIGQPVFAGSKSFGNGEFNWWIYERSNFEEGWLWSRLNGSSLDGGFECDDDYHITHWQPLLDEPKADAGE